MYTLTTGRYLFRYVLIASLHMMSQTWSTYSVSRTTINQKKLIINTKTWILWSVLDSKSKKHHQRMYMHFSRHYLSLKCFTKCYQNAGQDATRNLSFHHQTQCWCAWSLSQISNNARNHKQKMSHLCKAEFSVYSSAAHCCASGDELNRYTSTSCEFRAHLT